MNPYIKGKNQLCWSDLGCVWMLEYVLDAHTLLSCVRDELDWFGAALLCCRKGKGGDEVRISLWELAMCCNCSGFK